VTVAPKLRIVSGGPPDERKRGSVWESVLVFFVFLLVAPPLSEVIFFVAASLWAALTMSGTALPFLPIMSSNGIALLLFFAYAFGGLQAAAVGIVAAMSHAKNPTLPVPVPPIVVASMCAGVASSILIGFLGMRSGSWFLFVFVAHLGANLLCVLIANALLQRFWSHPRDGEDFRRRHER
jgi:hypothetical protein